MARSRASRRLQLAGIATDRALHTIAGAGRTLPISRPRRHGVEVLRDVPYRPTGRRAHRLDVYIPLGPRHHNRTALYVHGGAFGILSKDSHWLMALILARRGYLVFNINYRLAPKDPYPAAVSDVCDAFLWALANAERWGGDPEQMVLAGDSAGANLITALTMATSYRRDEPFARRVWEADVTPAAVLPASGIFQVSDCARFGRRRKMAPLVGRILEGVEGAYLAGVDRRSEGALDFADPLRVFERGLKPDRQLPPFFVAVGTQDPLLDDTRRLATALANLGGVCRARYYDKRMHVFHAAVWRRSARSYWRAAFEFVDDALATTNSAATVGASPKQGDIA